MCLAVAACAGAESSGAGLQRADSIVNAWVEEGRVPGAVLLVTSESETVFVRAYGSAQTHAFGSGQYPGGGGPIRVGEPGAMTPNTVFDLASVTKVMATTMAVMLLVDRGLMTLEAPVTDYLPDFSGDGKDAIMVEHLLTHRSGLSQWQPTYYHATNADEAYAFVRDFPLTWSVGAERHYSDLGFMVLGRVVEAVAGESLNEFLQGELYGPLGLTNTGFRGTASADEPVAGAYAATSHGNPFERRMVHDPDFGYRIEIDPAAWDGWRDYTLLGEVNDGNAHHAFRGIAGHAGLFSTAEELAVLLELLLDGGSRAGIRYMSSSVVDRFLETTGEEQALGWQVPEYAPPGSFSHTGFTGTYVFGDRGRGLGLVLLTNRQNVGVDGGTAYPDVAPLQRAVTLALTLDP